MHCHWLQEKQYPNCRNLLRKKEKRKKTKKNGELAGARTLDHRLKRAMLYRLSYQLTHCEKYKKMVSQQGLEPWTTALKGRCSTD